METPSTSRNSSTAWESIGKTRHLFDYRQNKAPLFALHQGGSFKPLFLGMILGEVTVAGFWAIVDAIAGGTGNVITYM